MENEVSKVYEILHCSNDYVNYTIQSYVDCYDDLDEKEIETLTEIFTSLKSHSFESGNKIVERRIMDGIILSPSEEKFKKRDTSELNISLEAIGQGLEGRKESLFYRSMVHLCDSVQYLSANEMLDLNDFFRGMETHKQFLGEKVSESDTTQFYPFDRSPKKYTK